MDNTKALAELGIEVRPMEITTVSCTGTDSILDAWLRYRDEYLKKENGNIVNIQNGEVMTENEYMEKVFTADLSLNYMEMIELNIKSSTMFREFLLQFDDTMAKWGMSSRDHAEFLTYCSEELSTLPGTLNAYKKFKEIQDGYIAGTSSFDAMREYLPVAYQTEFLIHLPVKQFMKYISIFHKYFSKVLPDTWKSIYVACYKNDDLRPWLKNILNYQDIEESRVFGGVENFNLLASKNVKSFIHQSTVYTYLGQIGSVLFSQLIRMENHRTYGYCEFIKSLPDLSLPNCQSTFPLYMAMSKERIIEVCKTRSSWFASNTYDGDPNAWNEFFKNQWVSNDIDDNKHLFKFFNPDGSVNRKTIDRYIFDDENRFHKNYNRFWISPFILEDGRIMIDRLHQQGYSVLVDMYCQLWKKGYFKDNPENPKRIQWYKWIDEENSSNTDYRKWTDIWNTYMTTDLTIKELMLDIMKQGDFINA